MKIKIRRHRKEETSKKSCFDPAGRQAGCCTCVSAQTKNRSVITSQQGKTTTLATWRRTTSRRMIRIFFFLLSRIGNTKSGSSCVFLGRVGKTDSFVAWKPTPTVFFFLEHVICRRKLIFFSFPASRVSFVSHYVTNFLELENFISTLFFGLHNCFFPLENFELREI